jgi:hypothetical protein
MTLEVSIRDEKAELFLELIQELKSSMVEHFRIVVPSSDSAQEEAWNETELARRVREMQEGTITPLTRQEVFDGVL